MPELVVLRGLPASGKTTVARAMGYRRLNKDDLRAMLDNGEYSPTFEDLVREAEQWMAIKALVNGWSVVVDDTNLRIVDVEAWGRVARITRTELRVVEVATAVEVCVERDAGRPDATRVGSLRILAMAERFEFFPADEVRR